MSYPVDKIATKLLCMAYNADREADLMSNMKLQKMLYYQQGFHLAYFNKPLFDEDIEAWMYGPVVPSVYYKYEINDRQGIVPQEDDDLVFDNEEENNLFLQVYDIYGKYSAYGLMNLTHSELPWRTTNVGKGNIIEKEKIKSYFNTLLE